MSGDFFDTNVFIYLFDEASSTRRAVSERLVENGLESGQAVISPQVVQETLNVLTKKLRASLAERSILLENVLIPLWRVSPTSALFRRALELNERYQFHFYDSLIVAAALEAGCDRLMSEDFQHGQRIEGLTFHNPFV